MYRMFFLGVGNRNSIIESMSSTSPRVSSSRVLDDNNLWHCLSNSWSLCRYQIAKSKHKNTLLFTM